MKTPHEKFCVLPWVSLEASPVGTVRPCCLAEDEIVDSHGNKFNLRTDGLGEIQNSKYMYQLRQEFLDGQQPATCRKCWQEEDSGRISKRMHSINRLNELVDDWDWTTDAKPLMFLDLKLGNICNLKCRICGSWSSSTFATEELQFVKPEDKKQSLHYQMLKKGAWPREDPKLWTEIDDILDQIRYLEFTGGEPFMIREHFDLLKKIVDRGLAHRVEIHYNTNCTQWPDEAEQLWKNFRLVEIALSIDDLGDRFEYQRTNANWTTVLENLEKFRQLRSKYGRRIQLQVCSTINVFNVMYLEELANWIDQQGFDFVYWNMLHEAYYFSIATLPKSAKRTVAQRLRSARVSEKHLAEFFRVVDFMDLGVSLDGHLLRRRIAELDQRRRQDLRDHHPELAAAIDYAGPGQ